MVKRKGFTLVELLIVIGMICMLIMMISIVAGAITKKGTYNSITPSQHFGPPSSQPSIVAGPGFQIRR